MKHTVRVLHRSLVIGPDFIFISAKNGQISNYIANTTQTRDLSVVALFSSIFKEGYNA